MAQLAQFRTARERSLGSLSHKRIGVFACSVSPPADSLVTECPFRVGTGRSVIDWFWPEAEVKSSGIFIYRRAQMPSQDHSPFRCPCCDQQSITETGCYGICDLCGWIDDPVQSANPDYPGCANQNSLHQAQDAWRTKMRNVVSDQIQNGLRLLRSDEDSLIRALLGHVSDGEQLIRQLEGAQVRDTDDGGMGSLEFVGDERRSLGSCLVEAEYFDCDGVLVSIALNVDQDERLYELDMWKVDFSPLREYPDFERVSIKA
jgi:hypothetical protein